MELEAQRQQALAGQRQRPQVWPSQAGGQEAGVRVDQHSPGGRVGLLLVHGEAVAAIVVVASHGRGGVHGEAVAAVVVVAMPSGPLFGPVGLCDDVGVVAQDTLGLRASIQSPTSHPRDPNTHVYAVYCTQSTW